MISTYLYAFLVRLNTVSHPLLVCCDIFSSVVVWKAQSVPFIVDSFLPALEILHTQLSDFPVSSKKASTPTFTALGAEKSAVLAMGEVQRWGSAGEYGLKSESPDNS